MTSTKKPTGAPTDSPAAAEPLAGVAEARGIWLAEATSVLQAHPLVAGVWLVGSLGLGDGDGYSDVDLIVAVDPPIPAALLTDPLGGLQLPGPVLYTRPKPRNAPAAKTYLAVCVELVGLPVLVDLYVWPVTVAAVPADGAVIYQRGEVRHSPLELLALLAEHPADDPAGADPDDPASLLFLIQLAAKYHARGDQPRSRHLPSAAPPRPGHDRRPPQLLENEVPHLGLGRAVAAVRRLLNLADAQPSPRLRPTRIRGVTPPGSTSAAGP